MDAQIRRRLSMAVRALEFSKAQTSTDPSYTAVVARLETDIDRADQLIVQERDGHTGERTAHATRAGLRRTMELQLRHLVHVALAASKTRPELKTQFKLVEVRAPNRVLLGAAQSMLATATVEKEVLLAAGLGETFLESLAKSIDAYEKAGGELNSGRIYHVGARADLHAIVNECVQLVSILHGLNRTRFASDPQQMAAWLSAKNVAGPFRKAVDEVGGKAA